MRVLILDNNIDVNCWGSADLRRSVSVFPGTTVFVRRAPHDDVPATDAGYDRLIVSGSKTSCLDDAPWIGRLLEFVRTWVSSGKPYLGVCYGHQSLIRALAGKEAVRKGTEGELGWTKIARAPESRLFEGLPSSFYSFSSHFEEASSPPIGFKVTAKSAACAIQAIESFDLPVFGVQFHPERNGPEADQSLAQSRKEDPKRPLLEAKRTAELYDPKVAQTIFGNFLRL